jgi:hypothetical protein
LYIIDSDTLVRLLPKTPLPKFVNKNLVLWEDKFAISVVNLNWETLNVVIALSGSLNRVESYNKIIDRNLQVKQDIMYLSVQLQEISARINEFQGRQSYDYFDKLLFRQILRKKKIKSAIKDDKIVINLSDIKIGNNAEGFIIYNNIYLYISQWNILDGYSLHFNTFSFSSFWDIDDVVLHPNLFTPYYIDMPVIETSYETYADNLVSISKGLDYSSTSPISITTIIRNFNRYRRIWNGLKDPREEPTLNAYKAIFTQEKK